MSHGNELWLDSRHISLFDVPEPTEVTAAFRYNFFVRDEKTNSSGMPEFQGVPAEETQRSIEAGNLDRRIPRYVEINFAPATAGFHNIRDLLGQGVLVENKGMVQSEASITTGRDGVLSFQEPAIQSRIADKATLLLQLLGAESNNPSEFELITNLEPAIDSKRLIEILAVNSNAGKRLVNDVGDAIARPVFRKASAAIIDGLVDRRLLQSFFGSNYSVSGRSKSHLVEVAKDDALTFLPLGWDDSSEDADAPLVRAFQSYDIPNYSSIVKSVTIGYIIERREMTPAGTVSGLEHFYVEAGPNLTQTSYRFLDTQVLYGRGYYYTVKTVALVSVETPTQPIELTTWSERINDTPTECLFLLSSRGETTPVIRTVETVPPQPPDGIFYRFNYGNDKGMYITWQTPVGKQRDTKYYQIFRRRSIHEPFACIAEIDFDNSEIRSAKKERVDPSRVIRSDGPKTAFMDPEFEISSAYIYAVAAVDAHGLSSGYSAQTMVRLNEYGTELELTRVSQAGALKQYPNFFIDPNLDENLFVDSLTDDSMQCSKKSSVSIYFTPDAVRFSTAGEGYPLLALRPGGLYKLLLLNVDRQKSSIVDLEINDLRTSPNSSEAS